jgi:drug/metabolite transporter (DMT)-like permease
MNITKETYMYMLAGLVIVSTLIISVILIFVPIPEKSHDILMTVLVADVGMCITIVGYYFGSSKSSADKTELMSKQANSTTP